MTKYRVVTTEEGNYLPQVFLLDPYLGVTYWKALQSYPRLTQAIEAIERYKNAGKVVWEE